MIPDPRPLDLPAARPWLDLLEEGVVLHDVDGTILDCSAPVERLLLIRAADLVGHASLFPRLEVHEEDGRPLRPAEEPVWHLLRTGQPSPPRRVRIRRADGREDWLSLRAVLADAGESGEAPWAVTIVGDANPQREFERQLREARRLEVLGRMAGHVAHDINNLLTVILGYGDVLIESLPPGSPAWREAMEIRLASERGTRVTARLLTLGRGESPEPAPFDLNRLLEEMQPMLVRVGGEGIVLEIRGEARNATVRADRAGFEQVLLNLVVNARDAMRPGGRLRLSTSETDLGPEFVATHPGARAGRHVVLTVADDGEGMDADTRAQAFEPFFTTRSAEGGLGLGLSIVRTVVQQAGGCVDLASEPGVGTTFSVYLPLAPGAHEAGGPAAAAGTDLAAGRGG